MLANEESEKDILMSFKRPKWPIRPNKRLHLSVEREIHERKW